MKKLILLFSLLFLFFSANAEEGEHHPKKHQHNDLGFANMLVYDLNEEAFYYGMHFHAIKALNDTWSLGVGYETIQSNNFD